MICNLCYAWAVVLDVFQLQDCWKLDKFTLEFVLRVRSRNMISSRHFISLTLHAMIQVINTTRPHTASGINNARPSNGVWQLAKVKPHTLQSTKQYKNSNSAYCEQQYISSIHSFWHRFLEGLLGSSTRMLKCHERLLFMTRGGRDCVLRVIHIVTVCIHHDWDSRWRPTPNVNISLLEPFAFIVRDC